METFQPVETYIDEIDVIELGDDSEEYVEEEDGSEEWLQLARDAYDSSDSYFSSSIRKQVEKNIALFNSRHPSGSKYHQDSYKYRSKIFRPKTRSSVRRHEASAATAFFSTKDAVACNANDQDDEMAVFGAVVGENLVNQRLSDPKLLWFSTCIGAYQDAMVQGVVISRQNWVYKKSADGMMAVEEDRPGVDIIPIENFRFDSAADWRDPVNTSPFLIELMPMYIGDVKERMEREDPKTGEPIWNKIEDEELTSGNKTGEMDSTRQSRTNERQDSKEVTYATTDFDIVWVHRNIIRQGGVDWIYYTLGTTALLSDPVPLKDVYLHGRPYVIGTCNIETHKTIPAGTVELTSNIQQEANDIANQRLDNVKLVVNRRSFVRRTAGIDVRGLTQSVPGGITLVDDINKDVRYDAPPDVTSSSYAEQDRLNNDFDDLAGSFSGGSVSTNRNLNKTVGGLEMLNKDSNSVTEYQLRVFSETWLKPVMHQLLLLEKYYESDPVRLKSASEGKDPQIALQALQSDITTTLSVGFGATDPQKQVEKLAFGLGTIAKFMPQVLQMIDSEEVIGEVFGSLGYQDGKRFFKFGDEDPQIAQMKQVIQQLQQQLQGKQAEAQAKLQIEQMKQQGQAQREQMKGQVALQIAKLKQDIEYIGKQIDAETNDIKRGDLIVQLEAFKAAKMQKELEYAISERDKMSDVLMRDQYGMVPGMDDRPGRG